MKAKKLDHFKQVRRINPLGFRVVVHICDEASVSEGGLYLPEGAKEKMDESLLAEVVEVATAHDEDMDDSANVSGVPLGAKVLVKKDAGVKVPWDDRLRIVETQDILGIVEEFSYS